MNEIVAPLSATPSAVERFLAQLAASCADDSLVRVTLSSPVAPATGELASVGKILIRLIDLKAVPHLSLTFRQPQRDVTRNLPLTEGLAWVRAQLGVTFRNAHLATTRRDWQLGIPARGEVHLVTHRPGTKTAPPRSHDEAKHSFLDASARDWLEGLGIADVSGRIRPAMADKHHQISRYLEILAHLAADCGWAGAPAVADAPLLTVADMGCGKGYLTFGAWHLFHRVWQRPVCVLGVETRPELTAGANSVAVRIGAAGLTFVTGDIASAELPLLDALIALHACNTATDDALRRGVEARARLLVVAPCCHQEVRPQLGQPQPLAEVLRHGLMAERMAEWATDGLRALFLEWAGYRVKLIEFVASEHTPKNLMLAAVKVGEPFRDTAARERILRFKDFFGIHRHSLDPLLAPLPKTPE
jgi:SAM-dependent methyltransferase